MDADRLLEAVGAALRADGETLLSRPEREEIDRTLAALRAAREGSVVGSIKRTSEAVDVATREFAARRMDAGIRKALAGQRLEDLNSLPPGERK